MRRFTATIVLFAAINANALEMGLGESPSVLAQRLGNNAAELAACGTGSADLRTYAAKAKALIAKRTKKADEAAVDIQIMNDSYRDQSARYNSGADQPACDTVVSRASSR